MNKKYRLRKVIQKHTPSPDLTAFHIELFDCGRSEGNDWEIERKRLPIGRMKYHRESSIQRQFRSATSTLPFTPASEAFLRDLQTQTPVVEEEELSICLDDLSLENEAEPAPEITINEPKSADVADDEPVVDEFFGAGDVEPAVKEKEVEKACVKSDSSDTSSDDDEFESADKDKKEEDESNEASCIPKFGGGFDPMQERTISIPTSTANTHNSDSTDAEDSVATIKDTVSIDVKDSVSVTPLIATIPIVKEGAVKETNSSAPDQAADKLKSPSPAPVPVEPKPTLESTPSSVSSAIAGSYSSVASEPISTTASDLSAGAPRLNAERSLDNLSKPLEAINTRSPETPSSPKSVRFTTES